MELCGASCTSLIDQGTPGVLERLLGGGQVEPTGATGGKVKLLKQRATRTLIKSSLCPASSWADSGCPANLCAVSICCLRRTQVHCGWERERATVQAMLTLSLPGPWFSMCHSDPPQEKSNLPELSQNYVVMEKGRRGWGRLFLS